MRRIMSSVIKSNAKNANNISAITQINQNGCRIFQGVIHFLLFHKLIKSLAGYGIPILTSSFLISYENDILLADFRELPILRW